MVRLDRDSRVRCQYPSFLLLFRLIYLFMQSPEVIRTRRLNLVYSDFWFLDGNIVLVAESAAFKVHRGQLERQSEVFSDLFSIPQPQEQELIDGCNWVELHDRASDLFYFLSAIYDGL